MAVWTSWRVVGFLGLSIALWAGLGCGCSNRPVLDNPEHPFLVTLVSLSVLAAGALLFLLHRLWRSREREAMLDIRAGALEEAAAGERRFRALFENLASAGCLGEVIRGEDGRVVDYRILDVNPAFERLADIARERLVGELASSIGYSDLLAHLDLYCRVAETGNPESFEDWFPSLGRHLSVVVSCPAPGRAFALLTDVSAQKRARELLEYRLKLLEIAATEPLHELLVKTLDEVERLTGSEVGFCHFLAADQQTLTLQAWSTRTTRDFCTAGGAGQHYNVDRAGVWVDCVKERRPVIHNDYGSLPHRKGLPPGHAPVLRELVVPIFRGGAIAAILGVGNKRTDYTEEDVTVVAQLADLAWELADRKRAEEALRESEQRLRALYEESPLGYHSLDAEGRVLDVNPRWLELLGYSREEIVGQWLGDFVVPEDLAEFRERLAVLVDTGRSEGLELSLRRKDGGIVTVCIDGRCGYFADGRFRQTHCLLRNVTQERFAERERKRIEAALRQQQRLESIGTLASGVAHEINNPLTTVMNFGQLLHDSPGDPAQTREYSKQIVKESERMAGIVKNLLSFARQERVGPSKVQLSDVFEQANVLMGAVLRRDLIELRTRIPEELPGLVCRPQQILQVLLNLLSNAQDTLNARYPNGSPDKVMTVSAAAFEQDGAPWILMTVADHGTGMTPEVAARVFDPFFTTKAGERGTGLGLWVSYGIVKEHGGRIRIESHPGEGTRMHVEIPLR